MRFSPAIVSLCSLAIVLAFLRGADAYIMVLGAHSQECFSEDLVENAKLQGSFDVVSGGFLDIDCTVYGPGETVHYTVQREKEGRFLMLAPTAGTYRVCFSNKMSTLAEKTISFNIHQGDSALSVELAKKEHITPLEEGITQLSMGVVNIQDEQRYMRARERSHRDTTESTNSRVLWFTFLEATVLVGMSLWQIWTLRRFFETRADL